MTDTTYRYTDAPSGADVPPFIDRARDWAIRVVVIQHFEAYPPQSMDEQERADIVADYVAEPDAAVYRTTAEGVRMAGALVAARAIIDAQTTLSGDVLGNGHGVALFSDGKLDRVDIAGPDFTYPDGVEYVHHGDPDDYANDPPVIYGAVQVIAELTPITRPDVVAVNIDAVTGQLGHVVSGGRPIANAERGDQ